VQSTATAHRLFAARPRSGALFDIAIATVALGGSFALLFHGGFGASRPGSELDLLGAGPGEELLQVVVDALLVGAERGGGGDDPQLVGIDVEADEGAEAMAQVMEAQRA